MMQITKAVERVSNCSEVVPMEMLLLKSFLVIRADRGTIFYEILRMHIIHDHKKKSPCSFIKQIQVHAIEKPAKSVFPSCKISGLLTQKSHPFFS